jgi:hypothetical protein
MNRSKSCLTLALLLFPGFASAQAPPKRPDTSALLPLLTGASTDSLAGALRGYLIQSMPAPLYEVSPNWGNTRNVARGIKWKGIEPKLIYVRRNDGKWRHIRVDADRPADTLILDLRDVKYPEVGRMTFTVFLAMDVRLRYDQQNWEGGVNLYEGSAAARFRVQANLHCEASAHLEAGQYLVPDAVFRLHVEKADVHYDNFVMEHVAGVGGEAAKVLGDAVQGGIHRWQPDLEAGLLAKANAAIEKAADTKDVRVNLFEVLKKAAPRFPVTANPTPAPPPVPVEGPPLAAPAK